MPADQPAQRAQCRNHLQQIGLALLNYESANHSFPPAYVPDESSRPKHSWRVLILPYIEQLPLYRQYDLKEPFDGPRNHVLARTTIPAYCCPSDPATSGGQTDYVMIVGPKTISQGPNSHAIPEIVAGGSRSIMLVEVSGLGINWMEPKDITLDDPIARLNSGTLRGPHPGGIHVLMCDGSVQFLTFPIDPQQLRAMATISGGEPVLLP